MGNSQETEGYTTHCDTPLILVFRRLGWEHWVFSIKPGVQSQYRANQDYRSNTCLENVGCGGRGEMGEWIQLLLSITSAELKAGVGEWGVCGILSQKLLNSGASGHRSVCWNLNNQVQSCKGGGTFKNSFHSYKNLWDPSVGWISTAAGWELKQFQNFLCGL